MNYIFLINLFITFVPELKLKTMKRKFITEKEFRNTPNHFIDYAELENKRYVFDEDGVRLEDYPPINWSRVAFAAFLVINVLFLLFVGIRIIFNF